MNFLNFENSNPDQHIYRIMPEDYVLDLFASRRNVLSQIHNWKDKFENFQLKLGGVLDGEAFNYAFAEDFVVNAGRAMPIRKRCGASMPTIPPSVIYASARRRGSCSARWSMRIPKRPKIAVS